MNFVFVSLQRINTDRDSTSTSLAKELAKNHNVLYVNSPIDRRTLYTKNRDKYTEQHIQDWREKRKGLKKIQNNLWVLNPATVIESINWIPFTSVFKVFNWLNNRRFAKDIREAIEELGFDQFILINDKDIFRSFYLKELLKPQKYIYLDRDYTVGMDYWKRHGVSLEPELMKKADAVVCNSPDFTNRAKLYNSNSFYIGNGYNEEQYNLKERSEEPEDLRNIPYPRIGYVGALITLRLNLELMIQISRQRPEWSFVFIGWEDEAFRQSELHQIPNVYFLGKKHTREVPTYIDHFNVCINPQKLNDITKGNFPLKIVEYLAVGKPVVATETNTMKEIFRESTYLAYDAETFASQIEKALRENNPSLVDQRKSFVSQFSWENVTSNLLNCIKSTSTDIEGEMED